MRRLRQKPRASASSKRVGDGARGVRIGVDEKIPHCRRAKGRLEQKLEMLARYRIAQHRESVETVDRPGDFGGAAMAMAHLPGDPARIARAGPHDPGDFLRQRAHLDGAGARRLDMIDGRIVAEHLRGGRKAAFMIDHGVGVENVLLVLVLNMNERVGGRDTLGECRASRRLRLARRDRHARRRRGSALRARAG